MSSTTTEKSINETTNHCFVPSISSSHIDKILPLKIVDICLRCLQPIGQFFAFFESRLHVESLEFLANQLAAHTQNNSLVWQCDPAPPVPLTHSMVSLFHNYCIKNQPKSKQINLTVISMGILVSGIRTSFHMVIF